MGKSSQLTFSTRACTFFSWSVLNVAKVNCYLGYFPYFFRNPMTPISFLIHRRTPHACFATAHTWDRVSATRFCLINNWMIYASFACYKLSLVWLCPHLGFMYHEESMASLSDYTKAHITCTPAWQHLELCSFVCLFVLWAVCHPLVKFSIVGSLCDREVGGSVSDRQSLNFESCVWRAVSSHSSHHPQGVLLAQFSLYVHKGGLKPHSFHFILFVLFCAFVRPIIHSPFLHSWFVHLHVFAI